MQSSELFYETAEYLIDWQFLLFGFKMFSTYKARVLPDHPISTYHRAESLQV